VQLTSKLNQTVLKFVGKSSQESSACIKLQLLYGYVYFVIEQIHVGYIFALMLIILIILIYQVYVKSILVVFYLR